LARAVAQVPAASNIATLGASSSTAQGGFAPAPNGSSTMIKDFHGDYRTRNYTARPDDVMRRPLFPSYQCRIAMADEDILSLTADIVAAHVSNNQVATNDLSGLIAAVHGALVSLRQPAAAEPQAKEPAVSIKASVKPDYVVCLVCGSKQKMLKRHLMSAHGLTPADYRAEFNLPASYPLAAPNYAKRRSELAQASGLGRRRAESAVPAAPAEAAPAPKAAATPAPTPGAKPPRSRLKLKTPA
jgi:predicted transcriptional regulator